MATGILDALGEAKAATVRIVEGANGSARCERRWHFPLPAVLRARRRPVPETALLEGVHCTVQACLLRPLRREYLKAFLERWCAGAPVQHCVQHIHVHVQCISLQLGLVRHVGTNILLAHQCI